MFNKAIHRLTTISVMGAMLSLSACTEQDEARDRDIEESDRAAPVMMAAAAKVFAGAAAKFGIGQAFEFIFSSNSSVDLSEESLQKIADIVDTSLATARFDEYEALTQALFTASVEYNRPNCDDPAPNDETACNDIEDTFGDKVDPILEDSNKLWNLLTNSSRNTDPIRLFYAQAIQMVAGIRLAFLAERRNIDQLTGVEQSTESGKNVCARAREYYPILQDLEYRWNDYFDEFTPVYHKEVHMGIWLGGILRRFVGCFTTPSGEEICGTIERECNTMESQCYPTSTDHLEEAKALKAQRQEEDWRIIMGGDNYYDNLDEVAEVIQQCDNAPPPPLPPPCDPHLTFGESLHIDERLWSCNGEYNLVMQGDGNLVLYGPDGAATWASDTDGSGADRAAMQGDGNFVVYEGDTAVWASDTDKPENSGARITVQDDGKLVMSKGDRTIWSKG